MTGQTQLRQQAFERLRQELLAEQQGQPFWQGRLSDSALATAVAVGMLAQANPAEYAAQIEVGLNWLINTQNDDGGWGDSTDSPSNLSTTALTVAAFRLAGRNPPQAAALYLSSFGPLATAISNAYGDDRTFSAPILVFCALAGMVEWTDAPQLPFELAVLPQRLFRFLRLSVVSYALPALIAIGLVRAVKVSSGGGIRAAVRRILIPSLLRKLRALQPESGGFLEAIPLTSFVALSLIAAGYAKHEVTQRCIGFVLRTLRPTGCWPIDVDLSIWNTTMATHALGGHFDNAIATRDWLIAEQRTCRHPYTGSDAGGWGWTYHSGSVPDADDTAGALLALATLPQSEASSRAGTAGAGWLLGLQNRDGGWPTFCRGWGKLEFDRSGCDLTAHAIRALHAWSKRLPPKPSRQAALAIERGLQFLASSQRSDGSWLPLWFGSQRTADQTNPLFGTSRVLLAYRDLRLEGSPPARQGVDFLVKAVETACQAGNHVCLATEEIAGVVEALAGWPQERAMKAYEVTTDWLIKRIGTESQLAPAPIGLYFAKLWYSESLYPISMAAAALRADVAAGRADGRTSD